MKCNFTRIYLQRNIVLKSLSLFLVIFLLIPHSGKAQGYQQDQVLRLGYRLGIEKFNGAYRTFNIIPVGNKLTYTFDKEYNDKIFLSNYEIWYGRFSENVFYEVSIDGLINATANMVAGSGVDYKFLFEKFRDSKENTSKEIIAIDNDILNFKMAFGSKGLYFGGQFKYTKLAYFSGASNENTIDGKELVGFAFSDDAVSAVGLGIHGNISVNKFIIQSHLMFNWVKPTKNSEQFFKGKEIEFESVINFGKEFGFYAAPFFKKRFGSKEHPADGAYGLDGAYRGLNSTFSIGLKLGIYIASEAKDGAVYIDVVK